MLFNRPKQLLKYSEWGDNDTGWYCNDTSDLCSVRAKWWVPARLLGITPAEYVELLIKRFKPDKIKYYQEQDVLIYAWKSQTAMRKFKNWLNAEARKKNFVI